MKVEIKNKHTGEVKLLKVSGFSWGIFFLGWIWAIVKKNNKKAVKLIVFAYLTFGIYSWVQCFKFNSDNWEYMQTLGWEVVE